MFHEDLSSRHESVKTPVASLGKASTAALTRIRHIMVPTKLSRRDRHAVVLATEMAVVHRAKLTLLHVLPHHSDTRSVHWLDAIEGLRQVFDEVNVAGRISKAEDAIAYAKQQVKLFLEREVPERLRKSIDIRIECPIGETANSIIRFVDEAGVDLIVLSNALTRRWNPLSSCCVRDVMRQVKKPVILAPITADNDHSNQSAFD